MYEAREKGRVAAIKDFKKGDRAGIASINVKYTSHMRVAAVNAYEAKMKELKST